MADNKESSKKVQENLQEIEFLRDAFTSLGASITDAVSEAINSTEEWNDVTGKIVKTYQREFGSAIRKLNVGLDTQIKLNIKIKEGTLKQKDIETERVKIQSTYEAAKQRLESLERNGVKISAEQRVELEGQRDAALENLQGTQKAFDLKRKERGVAGQLKDLAQEKLGITLKDINSTDVLLGLSAALGKKFLELDKSAGETARALGTSYKEVVSMLPPFTKIADDSNALYVTTLGVEKSFVAINKLLGTRANINAKDLVTFTKFSEQAKFSEETTAALYKTAQLTGKTLEENTSEYFTQIKALELQSGVVLNERTLLESISKTSAATRLTLGNSTKEIAKAAVAAQMLGVEMEDINKIAGSLLNFESSIEAELQAELLTGKSLNLERARYAALNGDIATVATEIAQQIGSAEEFTKMNVLQQDALAKAMGLSREELAGMLEQQKLLEGSQFKSVGAAQEALKVAQSEGREREFLQGLGNESLANQLASQSAQERLNQSLSKMGEALAPIAELALKIIEPFASLAEKILPSITKHLDKFIVLGGTYFGIVKAMAIWKRKDALIDTARLAITAARSAAATPIIGPALAAVAAAGAYALGKKFLGKADDMISPGYGKRMLSMPEGDIALNDNDTIVAGTNLNQGSGGNVDTGALIKAIDRLGGRIAALEFNVNLDSTKLGTAISTSTSKIQ